MFDLQNNTNGAILWPIFLQPREDQIVMSRSDPTGISVARDNILKWAQRPEWRERFLAVLQEHVSDVLEEFEFDSMQDLFDELSDEAYVSDIMNQAIDDFLTRGGLENEPENIISEYLRRRGYRETEPARRYLEAISESVISIYEVVESVPGSHLVLRDRINGGDPIRVTERTASQQLVRWDRIGCRIVPRLHEFVILSTVLALDPDDADDLENQMISAQRAGIEDLRETVPQASDEERRKIVEFLVSSAFAPIITSTWVAEVLSALEEPLSDIKNADGDDIVLVETRWPIRGAARAIEAALDRAQGQGLQREPAAESPTWRWSDDPSVEDAASPEPETDENSLGMLRIEKAELVLHTDSKERASRGRALIEEALTDIIGPATDKLISVEELPEIFARMGFGLPKEMGDLIPPEAEAEFKQTHYRKWLDEPIPLLDGKSPREAARSPDLRPDLLALLKGLENVDAHRARDKGKPVPDYEWLWRELNIPRDEAPR
jgi:hypothetical protein